MQQIVLDECHKAKNLVPSGSSKPTKTGLTVLELQRKLPKARVIYCSATGMKILDMYIFLNLCQFAVCVLSSLKHSAVPHFLNLNTAVLLLNIT